MTLITFVLLATFGILIPVLLSLYTIYQFISDFKGAPYVPTSAKIVDEILKEAKLKKGQIFLELGSGDGRVVRKAVKDFKVNGIGVDINLFLLTFSKLISKIQKIKNIEFRNQDLFKTDLKKVDVLFLFLIPKTLRKIAPKILKDCKKGTLVISHGFKLDELNKYQIKKIDRKHFPTYYYKIE